MSPSPGLIRIGLALLAAATLATACSDAVPPSTAPRTALGAPNPANLRGPRAEALLSRGGPSLNVFGDDPATAIISNGVIQLGVNAEGHLNIPGGVPSTGSSPTTFIGLRYLPTNGEATAPGCLCEGWGAADVTSESFGYANEDYGGAHNMVVESFTSTASSAVSVVIIHAIDPCVVNPVTPDPACVPDGNESGEGPALGHTLGGARLRVTHDYHPSPATQNLYEVTVTIENLTDGPMGDVRYRRVMDWDIAPNTFTEYVTIGGTAAATNVLHADNNGFQSANPMTAPEAVSLVGATYVTGDVVDAGAEDIGAMFDFGFGRVEPFASVTFKIFYGASHDQTSAAAALAAVGAEVFSFGQASWDGNGDPLDGCGVGGCTPGAFGGNTGQPHTFIFAFSGVGGDPLIPPVARAGGPYAARLEGSPGTFTDGGSTDADGSIVTREWNFHDGTPHLFGSPVVHAFYDNGVFPVTLRVTDDDGLSGEDTKFVTVINGPPNVYRLRLDASTQNVVRVGKTFWAEWSFRDPGLLDSPWAWTITWGDGGSNLGFESLQGNVMTRHVYTTPGTKTVKFTITDKDGASHSRTIPVVVLP